jgi:cbb3-type cytochrome oxidase maturation protein
VDILYLLIPMSVVIVLAIGAIFWWAIASGQFDELDRESESVLEDDESGPEHKP